MDPTAVLAAYPGARFVARARVNTDGAILAPAFAGRLAGEVWGILVAVPEATTEDAETREVVTDDGRRFRAALEGPLVAGEPAEALAAARYWELPPAYVVRLSEAVAALGGQTGDEEA